ncbi:MAG: hypothetical protein ABFD86_09340 [Bryobacteraceae bacterium]
MCRILLGCALAAILQPACASPSYVQFKQKTAMIVDGKAAPGSRIVFTKPQIDAFLNEEAIRIIPGSVYGAHVELGYGRATGGANMNFVKLLQARGTPPGWLFTKMFEGWKPVHAAIRVKSGGGRATVYLDSLELSGMPVPNMLVDFIVRHFAQSYSPDIRLGEPFPLNHRIERLELAPSGFAVVIRR